MRRMWQTMFGVGLAVLACRAWTADTAIAPDRMLLVNGQRTFVIGLYENPGDDAVLDEVAHAGFNLVQASAKTASLDRLYSRGLYGWVNIGTRTEIGDNREEGKKALEETVSACGAHPALLVWEIADESLWSCMLNAWRQPGSWTERAQIYYKNAAAESARMAAGNAVMKELDTHHPIWENYAAGNAHEQVAAYAQGADIIGADIYPLMPYPTHPVDISRCGLGYVGTCTMKMQRAAPEKPVWMVLQGMSWGDVSDNLFPSQPMAGQRPDYAESRFMAYDAIVRGARGILYWGTAVIPKDCTLWKDLMKVAQELAGHKALLSAPDASLAPTVDTRLYGFLPWDVPGSPIGVQVLGKVVDGQTWWIVVNELFTGFSYTLNGLDSLNGTAYTDTATGQSATVEHGTLSLSIPRYGVHVLKPGGA